MSIIIDMLTFEVGDCGVYNGAKVLLLVVVSPEQRIKLIVDTIGFYHTWVANQTTDCCFLLFNQLGQ